jgi:hypothetical protein
MPSLTRGLITVGSEPAILLTTFLGALCLWLLYLSLQSVRILSPSDLAQMLALPPVHSVIDRVMIFGASSRLSSSLTLVIGIAVLLVRAALLAFLIALITQALTGGTLDAGPQGEDEDAGTAPEASATGEIGAARGPGAAVRSAGLRTVRTLSSMFLFETGFLVLLSILWTLVSFLGQVGLAIVLVALMYYLLFVPVIAVVEQARPRDAMTLGLRLVRQSSRQSLLFASGYVLISLFFLVLQAPFASASPSIQVWGYVLLSSFVHMSVLAAVVIRWLAVRDTMVEGWTPARRPGWMDGLRSARTGERRR